MAEFRVKKAKPIAASITVPGDKSISHRAIMFSALTDGPCRVTGFLPSEDCLSTLKAFRQLGVKIDAASDAELQALPPGQATIVIHGTQGKFTAPTSAIDCGNSGTTMRLMCGFLAAQPFSSELFGDASLTKRPMKRVIDPLTQMGARFSAHGEKGLPPLKITGSTLSAINYRLPMASAQVKSAVLLAGLFCEGNTTVVEPIITRNHTEKMLEYFGIQVRRTGDSITLRGGQRGTARDFRVPGDISSAAFWLVAAAAQEGSQLMIENVGLNPTRTGIIQVLTRMGAHISEVVEHAGPGEPYGHLVIRGCGLRGTTISGAEIANVIDELPVLAVAAALAQGVTTIKDAQELRVKETDRIAAVAANLRAMGVTVKELEDGMEITGGATLHAPAQPLPTHHDHRIAMAFAMAGLFAEGETVISGAEAVDTSYPGFAHELARFQSHAISSELKTPIITRLAMSADDDLGTLGTLGTSSTTKKSLPETGLVIAIDGPAASGKSTVARQLADTLGLAHLNTGAMYRAVTWAALQKGISPTDIDALDRWITELEITCTPQPHGALLLIHKTDPSPYLSSPEVNDAVSAVSRAPQVRAKLVALQRAFAEKTSVVMEGRDIGTVVFPHTRHKFYIDASPEIRAQRRAAQGLTDTVAQRDHSDSTRQHSPLAAAADATIIDTSDLPITAVLRTLIDHLKKQGLAV
jgi:3-phosphoshikimate 1-carboxyvinyltransferase